MPEEIFIVDKIQFTRPVTFLIKDLNEEDIKGSFYELQLAKQEVFRIEKVLKHEKKKGLALVKWKGYDDSFNLWISLRDIFHV